jgi:hypothetical protein
MADNRPTDPIDAYRELLTFGRTETEEVYAPPEVPRKGHEQRARWVEQVCEQARIDGFAVWSDPDSSNTDAMLASVGVWLWAGAVELLQPDGTRYPTALTGLTWWTTRFELKRRIEADWAAKLLAARGRAGMPDRPAESEA